MTPNLPFPIHFCLKKMKEVKMKEAKTIYGLYYLCQ